VGEVGKLASQSVRAYGDPKGGLGSAGARPKGVFAREKPPSPSEVGGGGVRPAFAPPVRRLPIRQCGEGRPCGQRLHLAKSVLAP